MDFKPRVGDYFLFTIHLDQSMEAKFIDLELKSINGRVKFGDIYKFSKSNGKGNTVISWPKWVHCLQVALEEVPFSQASLSRSPLCVRVI